MKKYKHKILKNPSDKELLKQLNNGWEIISSYRDDYKDIMRGVEHYSGMLFILRKPLNDNCKCEMVAYIKEMDK